MNGRIVLALVAIALVLAALVGISRARPHHSTFGEADARAVIGPLTDRSDGTNLTLVNVPWCVKGISAGEWQCHVRERNHSTGEVWLLDVWATCTGRICELEKDQISRVG